MANRNDENDRDRTGGTNSREGRGAEREVARGSETGAGHPVGGRSAESGGDQLPEHMPPYDTDPQHAQHTRKGQAQSPRELTHNEPPRKKEGHQ